MLPREESDEIRRVELTVDHRSFVSYVRGLGRETLRNDEKKVARDISTETNRLSFLRFRNQWEELGMIPWLYNVIRRIGNKLHVYHTRVSDIPKISLWSLGTDACVMIALK